MAFKKIDKEFHYTDSSLNVYGFRCLTSGYMIEEFQKNPIGFYMHGESTENSRELGVLVKWEDFRIDGDAVFAKPVINLSHPRGQQTCDEIEEGFLNGASVGKIIALEYSDDPAFMLPGQMGPTITRWYHRELSLVDIPGNFNALSLFDKDGNAINLADFKNQKTNMKQIFLTPELISFLNLSDNADQATVSAAIKDLSDKAKKVDGIQIQLDTALADKANAETALAAVQTETKTAKVKSLLETALADKKITVALQTKLEKQFAGKPDELSELLADMQPYQPITEAIKGAKEKLDDKFQNLSFSELDKAGLLPDLKAANLDLFKEKFKAEYKTEYKG